MPVSGPGVYDYKGFTYWHSSSPGEYLLEIYRHTISVDELRLVGSMWLHKRIKRDHKFDVEELFQLTVDKFWVAEMKKRKKNRAALEVAL